MPAGGKERNAYKKLAALRARKAPIFWAVGPDRAGAVYRVAYAPEGEVTFAEAADDLLRFAGGEQTALDAFTELKHAIEAYPILASDGDHSARLWRVAEGVLEKNGSEGELHLLSRVGQRAKGIATDLRSGQLSPEDAARLLAQLATVGEVAFQQWLNGEAQRRC